MKKYRSQRAGSEIIRTYDALLREWGVDYEELDIEGRYGSTHVIAAGDKDAPPVVLFHGVGDDAALMWLYNAAYLARSLRLYAVDTIGGPGKSEPGAGYNKDFDDVVWIDELFDGLGLQSASVVGVSHGGYLAQLYALCRPERVRNVVCISSSAPAGKSGSPMKSMMKIFLPEALFPTDRNVRRLLIKLSGDNVEAFTGNPLVMEHYRYLLKGFNNMAIAYHRVRFFTDEEIDSLRDRVVYLLGGKDPFQTLGGRSSMARCNMNARYFESAGHGLNHELADEINPVLAELLAR